MARTLSFTLPAPYPLEPGYSRLPGPARLKMKKAMRGTIIEALGGTHALPALPFPRALLRLERWSVECPDPERLASQGAHLLIQSLISPRHHENGTCVNPYGLGVIVSTSPEHLTTRYRAIPCRLSDQKTVVTITDLTKDPS